LPNAISQILANRSPLQRLRLPHGEVDIQRDDLLHPFVSGNKGRKLFGWVELAASQGLRGFLTFGGAHSNHLVATAAAAQALGMAAVGILRGDEPLDNPRLAFCRKAGMELIGVSRQLYRDKASALESVPESLKTGLLVVPEGGCGSAGLSGFVSLAQQWREAGYHP
jgi:1-aminocyclopropane-1-carboxylate deaminase